MELMSQLQQARDHKYELFLNCSSVAVLQTGLHSGMGLKMGLLGGGGGVMGRVRTQGRVAAYSELVAHGRESTTAGCI